MPVSLRIVHHNVIVKGRGFKLVVTMSYSLESSTNS